MHFSPDHELRASIVEHLAAISLRDLEYARWAAGNYAAIHPQALSNMGEEIKARRRQLRLEIKPKETA
jgi:hypothetical protein